MTEPDQSLRAEVAAALPPLIRETLAVYERFAAKDPPEDAKEFTAFQGACKAALAHLEALLKLERSLTPESETPDGEAANESAVLTQRIAEARAALARMRAEP